MKHFWDVPDDKHWKRYVLRKKFTSDEDNPKWRFNKNLNDEVLVVVHATGDNPVF